MLALTKAGIRVEINVKDYLVKACCRFVCALYGQPTEDIVELRYQLICCRASQAHKLPPTMDMFQKHVLCCIYQAFIWRKALEACPEIPFADGHGWKLDDGHLSIGWMIKEPAPVSS